MKSSSGTTSRTSAPTSATCASALVDKLELLLAESLRAARVIGALRTRVTVDTTVQPKAIPFPTDAKLVHAAIKGRSIA